MVGHRGCKPRLARPLSTCYCLRRTVGRGVGDVPREAVRGSARGRPIRSSCDLAAAVRTRTALLCAGCAPQLRDPPGSTQTDTSPPEPMTRSSTTRGSTCRRLAALMRSAARADADRPREREGETDPEHRLHRREHESDDELPSWSRATPARLRLATTSINAKNTISITTRRGRESGSTRESHASEGKPRTTEVPTAFRDRYRNGNGWNAKPGA